MKSTKSLRKRGKLNADDQALLAAMLGQLNGVLVCTLAACEGRALIPDAVQNALFTAAQLAQNAQQML